MENLIYIIIGIAWVAYSLYSARQKAMQKQQSAGMPPQGPSQSSPLPIPGNQGGGKSLLDEILRELTGEQKPAQQTARPVVVPAPVSYSKSSAEVKPVMGTDKYNKVTEIYTDTRKMEPENARKIHGQAVHITKDESHESWFNLREAVIYSEILNRKYT